MKRDLAAKLLADVLGDAGFLADPLADDLLALARAKYDGYLGYRPGARFLESLLRWLSQFDHDDRLAAARFVRDRLLFVSRAELQHLVELVYPTAVRPALLRRTGARTGLPPHHAAAVASTVEFAADERATLVLGLSDGALLDVLRRVTPQLRHQQLFAVPELTESRLDEMLGGLEAAQAALGVAADRRFGLVLLVDDFSATATTLLRHEEGRWQGRLWSAAQHLVDLRDRDALAADHEVRVVLYLATEQAERRLCERLEQSGLGWHVDVMQRIGADHAVTAGQDPEAFRLCRAYGGTSLPFGCGDAALPLVLHHNTPDNSVAVLWQDRGDDGPLVPLFPRYERYPWPPARATGDEVAPAGSNPVQASPRRRAT